MRIIRFPLVVVVLLTLLPAFPALADSKGSKHIEVREFREGHAFCPSRALVIRNVAVRGGQCYVLAVLRSTRGAFLAFMDAAVRIPPGELVRLDTSSGQKIRSRIVFLVPIQTTPQILVIPVNTIQLVRLREEDEEDEDEDEQVRVLASRLIVILTSSPLPNVIVTFVVRF